MLDKDIRELLFDYLDERYGRVRTIEEKIIGRSRADVLAIIDGAIIGMEIKSDSDSYTRLKSQVRSYDIYCNFNYVVVGESHIHVEEHVPSYWGIIYVNEENVIVERDASPNPKVDILRQLDLLWRNELLNIQMKEGLPKLMNTRRKDIYQRLIDTAGEPTIRADMTEQLMERDYTLWDDKTYKSKVTSKSQTSARKKANSKSVLKTTHVITGRKRKSNKASNKSTKKVSNKNT